MGKHQLVLFIKWRDGRTEGPLARGNLTRGKYVPLGHRENPRTVRPRPPSPQVTSTSDPVLRS
eukprot:scaffold512053_cov46-Prasinocladus_malaysianus.AAC.1